MKMRQLKFRMIDFTHKYTFFKHGFDLIFMYTIEEWHSDASLLYPLNSFVSDDFLSRQTFPPSSGFRSQY